MRGKTIKQEINEIKKKMDLNGKTMMVTEEVTGTNWASIITFLVTIVSAFVLVGTQMSMYSDLYYYTELDDVDDDPTTPDVVRREATLENLGKTGTMADMNWASILLFTIFGWLTFAIERDSGHWETFHYRKKVRKEIKIGDCCNDDNEDEDDY